MRGVSLAGGEIVEGNAVVIAMGPWSILAARSLPLPAVLGYKGHSLVFETGESVPAEALFLELREASGEILTLSYFRAQIAPRTCVRSRVLGRCQWIPPTLHLTSARTRARSPVSEFRRACGGAIKARQACIRPAAEDRVSTHRCGSGY